MKFLKSKAIIPLVTDKIQFREPHRDPKRERQVNLEKGGSEKNRKEGEVSGPSYSHQNLQIGERCSREL